MRLITGCAKADCQKDTPRIIILFVLHLYSFNTSIMEVFYLIKVIYSPFNKRRYNLHNIDDERLWRTC
jgi:hypothetical protein